MKKIIMVSTLLILMFFLTSVASAGYNSHHNDKYEKHNFDKHKRNYIKCDENGTCFECKNKKCTPLSNYTCKGKKCCKDGKCWPCKNCKGNNSFPDNNNSCPTCGNDSNVPDGDSGNESIPPVSSNETGKTVVTMCKGNTCIYGNNGKMTLTNYNNAKDPTYAELIAFAKSDKTDERSYNANSYNCMNFAQTFHNSCEANGIKAGWTASKGMDHAFNIFQTTDKGIVYIDCTGVPGGKSNQDKEITISGNRATGRSLYEGWTFTYDGTVGTLETYW
jgi:hypothetical protein